jgi:hypothetical protein
LCSLVGKWGIVLRFGVTTGGIDDARATDDCRRVYLGLVDFFGCGFFIKHDVFQCSDCVVLGCIGLVLEIFCFVWI